MGDLYGMSYISVKLFRVWSRVLTYLAKNTRHHQFSKRDKATARASSQNHPRCLGKFKEIVWRGAG